MEEPVGLLRGQAGLKELGIWCRKGSLWRRHLQVRCCIPCSLLLPLLTGWGWLAAGGRPVREHRGGLLGLGHGWGVDSLERLPRPGALRRGACGGSR